MEKSIPWIEKYRPNNLTDVMLDTDVRAQINVFTESNNNQHLIITGPPGLGKTTSVKCIARKILGDNVETGYLELNAAEDRGVKSISEIIPPFCRKVVPFKECKIILFDEADQLTPKCQADINSLIKTFGSKTKFIFTCNDSRKIIEDIQSVCRIVQFRELTKDLMKKYLIKICEKEKIKYDSEGMEMIYYISGGDMRKGINGLQATAYTHGSVTKDNVLDVCQLPDPEDMKYILRLCSQKKLEEAYDILEKILEDGYYFIDVVNGFNYVLVNCPFSEAVKIKNPSEELRLQILYRVHEVNINIRLGIRSKIQLTNMLCQITALFL